MDLGPYAAATTTCRLRPPLFNPNTSFRRCVRNLNTTHFTKSILFALIALTRITHATVTFQTDTQVLMSPPILTQSEGWTISLSQDWDVLGPFPIHAREQHFLSPSFPLNLSEPIDLNGTWSSSYADGGAVGWAKTRAGEDGLVEVSYPAIRWGALRATEGWAALQHHSVLRSTFIVNPPSTPHSRSEPHLLVNLLQGSFFTILPSSDAVDEALVPEWHAGNVYVLGKAPPNVVKLPHPPSLDSPTTYQIIVSGDYEIRLFGDPRSSLGTEVPKLSVTLTVGIQDAVSTVVRDESHDIVGDFVDGWAFGNAIGIGLRSLDGWWAVTSATVNNAENLTVSLLEKSRIAPTQTRVIPVILAQTGPVYLDELEIKLTLKSGDSESEVHVQIPLAHHPQWSSESVPASGIKATFFYATSMPAAFLVTPPKEPLAAPLPPILALHGAGVDIFSDGHRFWIQALPRQAHSWIVAPAGRTEWGLDWHGPSARDAWGVVDALGDILASREEWNQWGLAPQTKVVLMGHSNGGQGAWYVAGRYPDRVLGVVPAAGYVKSQAYVPWVQSRSAHYVDPALRAILDSSLTPDDNDLFLSNLATKPILAIHGGDDENVPVWHTRELVSAIKTWNPRANVTYREDPGERHWYSGVFKNDEVAAFVSATLSGQDAGVSQTRSFTLTVAVPSDSGSLHGWSIHRLGIPGRLGRLTVNINPSGISVETSNIGAFSFHPVSLPKDVQGAPFLFDGQVIKLDEATWGQPNVVIAFVREEDGVWKPHALFGVTTAPPTGRISNVLSSTGPITIVVPSRSPSPELSAALRIAHNLNVYHKLDTVIVDDHEAALAVRDGSLASGNFVVLSQGKLGGFAASLVSKSATPFGVDGSILRLRSRSFTAPSTGVLFLHPHPTNAEALTLFVYGTDESGLERALRLFPVRTGVTVPDWIVVGPQADARGTGGVQSAGVWGNDWRWNEAMSAF